MYKRLFAFYIICCFAAHMFAQQDSILLRINNKEITRSEFETAYNKSSSSIEGKKDVGDFLSRFIDDKLKMIEANAMGLDTTSNFRRKMQAYRESLRMSSLASRYKDTIYQDAQQKSHSMKRVSGKQIYKYIPQNCSNTELEETIQLMNQLHEKLNTDPHADFDAYVDEYSDHKDSFEIGWMESPVEFEQKVFSMERDEISAPFFTPQGIHIVKVSGVKDSLLDDGWNNKVQLRLRKKYKNETQSGFLQQLKDMYHYMPNSDGVKELLAEGKTDKILFTINGKPYTNEDFRYFSEVSPQGIRRQFHDFVIKSLIDCEQEQLGIVQPEQEQSIEEYKDALLLSEVTRLEVTDKARMDRAGLSAYFSVHKKDYRWPRPRFRGVVLHTRDKKIISEARKLVKKKPVDEWQQIITEVYNSGVVQQVQVEQGLYQEGDNIFVDDLVFKKQDAVSPSSYPFTAVIGKKIKGPENYKEAPESLVSDYELFLERQWMKRLHKAYRVEINEEVLKTVNNH